LTIPSGSDGKGLETFATEESTARSENPRAKLAEYEDLFARKKKDLLS
jgi:hypothetical protein